MGVPHPTLITHSNQSVCLGSRVGRDEIRCLPIVAHSLCFFDSTVCAVVHEQGRHPRQSVEAALEGGAGVVQLRLKNTDGSAFLEQVYSSAPLCSFSHTPCSPLTGCLSVKLVSLLLP